MSEENQKHWENVYASKLPTEVSWFQSNPATSLNFIKSLSTAQSGIVDIGGGASLLVDRLLDAGFTDLTVVEISQQALDLVRERLKEDGDRINLVHSDVLEWQPNRIFDLWHDRAVFHFLTSEDARDRYVALARSSLKIGGHLILATFAEDGPTMCSGLEVCRYSAEQLAAQFSDGFKLVDSRQEEHVTPSGGVQKFTWAVLEKKGSE